MINTMVNYNPVVILTAKLPTKDSRVVLWAKRKPLIVYARF